MAVRLTVTMRAEQGGADHAQTVMLDDDVITLGRDQACQVVLAQTAVSRAHARISRDGSLYFLEDLGSSFGTTINSAKIPKGEKRLLSNGDLIGIAQFDVTFDRTADGGGGENKPANKGAFVSRKVMKDVMKGLAAGGEQPYFRVMNGPVEGHRIEISDAQEFTIGRDDSADVILQDDLVSRRHCKVRRDWSGTHVEDLGSRNGFKVNKEKSTRVTLKDRDEVEIGGVRLLYIDPSEVRETPLVLPSDDQDEPGENTNTLRPELPAGAGAQPLEPRDESAGGDEEPPPDQGQGADADAPPSEENPTSGDEDSAADGDEHAQESDADPDDEAGPRGLIDFSSKQTIAVLAIVGVMVVLAIALLVVVLVGA